MNSCPRGHSTCTPIGLIASTETFVCAGLAKPGTNTHEQDKFKHCWYTPDLDIEIEMDESDMLHTITVLSQTLAFTNAF